MEGDGGMNRILWSVDFEARFWSRVSVGEPEECWGWLGTLNHNGYGLFGAAGTQVLAHRFAYDLASGDQPGVRCVLHRCDNPPCVNPDHLFLGTRADNMRDMRHKNRGAKGSRTGGAKLTEPAVAAARERWSRGELQADLAAEFGVTQGTMSVALNGRTWRHVR